MARRRSTVGEALREPAVAERLRRYGAAVSEATREVEAIAERFAQHRDARIDRIIAAEAKRLGLPHDTRRDLREIIIALSLERRRISHDAPISAAFRKRGRKARPDAAAFAKV